MEIISRIPQGLVLGPLLFNAFLNHLFLFVSQFYNFVSDKALFYYGKIWPKSYIILCTVYRLFWGGLSLYLKLTKINRRLHGAVLLVITADELCSYWTLKNIKRISTIVRIRALKYIRGYSSSDKGKLITRTAL